MTMRHAISYLFVFLVASLLLDGVHAQERDQAPLTFDGVDVLTYLLREEKFTPIRRVEDVADRLAYPPQDTVIIIFGSHDVLTDVEGTDGNGLRDFFRLGGNVL